MNPEILQSKNVDRFSVSALCPSRRQISSALMILLLLLSLVFGRSNMLAAPATPGMFDIVPSFGDSSYAVDVNSSGDVTGWYIGPNGTPRCFVYKDGVATDLGTLGGDSCSPAAINENGEVIGSSNTSNNQFQQGFIFKNGTMFNLGTLGGFYTTPTAINDNGDVVGSSEVDNERHAFLYQNGLMTDLGTLGGRNSFAEGINNSGQIVGRSTIPDGPYIAAEHAFLYENGQMIDLGTMGSVTSQAKLINDSGVIVGTLGFDQENHLFVYSNGVMSDLGSLGNSVISPTAINNDGEFVGITVNQSQQQQGFLYRDGAFVSLGTLGGDNSYPAGINAAGDVVGFSDTTNNSQQRAFVYKNESMINLGTLGGNNSAAYAINDNGDVVGFAETDTNAPHAFLLNIDGLENDLDFDGIPDLNDNCPTTTNPDQRDTNADGVGDLCTPSASPAAGHFVIGNLVDHQRDVTFWGAAWSNNNPMSSGSAPATFKGFASNSESATCGGSWTSRPGNSSNPPASVPEYMTAIVSSSIWKAGPVIHGNIRQVVVIKTNPGYGPSPGSSGMGQVVAILCSE